MNQLVSIYLFITARIHAAQDSEDRGATATEYAMLVAFIACAIVFAVTAFGTALSNFFGGLGTRIGVG